MATTADAPPTHRRPAVELFCSSRGQKHMEDQTPQPDTSEQRRELSSSAKGNLELLTTFKDGEEAQIAGVRLLIERISAFLGSPAYFAFAVVFIVAWVSVNGWAAHAGW